MSAVAAVEAPTGCGACGAPTGDHLRLCRADQRSLVSALDELAGHIADLEITRTRQDRVGQSSRRSPGFGERPLIFNEHAAGVSDVVAATVTAWAVDCHHRDEDGRDPLTEIRPSDIGAITRWLRRAMPILRAHPEAGLAHSQLVGVTARARAAIDLPRTASTFVVGPCPERKDPIPGQVHSSPCEGTVYAAIGFKDAPSVMRCNGGCGRVWGTAEWLRAGRRILARMREMERTA